MRCRICGSKDLRPILDLGEMALTGVFQKHGRKVKRAPLELMLCLGACGLLQLKDAVPRSEVFGPSYGYESGINDTMREHLNDIVQRARARVLLGSGDVVLDIGSNDGTLLNYYPGSVKRIGIDPSGERFAKNYTQTASYWDKRLIVGYFSRKTFKLKAKIITSIAMFYDLENPLAFMRDIKASLAPEGIWITEQSYMPTMLKNVAYDTVCHEHIEYYGLRQIKWMADKVGLEIIDASLSDINGGSFCVTLGHKGASFGARPYYTTIQPLLDAEAKLELVDYRAFSVHARDHRAAMRGWLAGLIARGKSVLGYGASTKGNVILQYCGITVKAIADRNPAKWGLRTPGTNIPIISEDKARAMKPDYFLVLPWHFRREIEAREKAFTDTGGKLFFPLGANL